MGRKRHTPEQIITALREAEVARLASAWRALDLDANDTHYDGGLLLASAGFGWIYGPAALIVFGTGLVYQALRRP